MTNFKEFLEKNKDIINKQLTADQIYDLHISYQGNKEGRAYVALLKIILMCLNRQPLYLGFERNIIGGIIWSIGTVDYDILRQGSEVAYDTLDIHSLLNDRQYLAKFILDNLYTDGSISNDLSVRELTEFLKMTNIILG